MDKAIVITILVTLLCFSRLNCQDENNETKKIKIDPKQIAHFAEKVSFFRKLNSNVTLEKLGTVKFEENINFWKFDTIIPNNNVSYIYKPSNIEKPFNCTPNITSCYNLKISNLTKDLIGTYFRQSESIDLSKYFIVEYYLNAYETPIHVICTTSDPREKCKYNSTTNTLTVTENVKVFLTCYTNIYNVSSIPELTMEQSNGTNNSCIYNNEIDGDIYDASNIDPLATIKIDKTCLRTFRASDSLFTCLLRNGTNQTDKKYRNELDRIDIKLNVMYRPKLNETENKTISYNITVPQGKHVVLICPYNGNPIIYEWRNMKNDSKILSNNKSFPIPKDLHRGVHTIECRISVPGDTKSLGVKKFTVNVVKAEASILPKNYIVGISIAAIVLAAIILAGIAVLIVCSIKKGKGTNESKPTNDSSLTNPDAAAPVPINSTASNQDVTPANS